MKKYIILITLTALMLTSLTYAKQGAQRGNQADCKYEQKQPEQRMVKEQQNTKEMKQEKVKQKDTKETPKGINKAAENNKGQKKGFWKRWFGKDKDAD